MAQQRKEKNSSNFYGKEAPRVAIIVAKSQYLGTKHFSSQIYLDPSGFILLLFQRPCSPSPLLGMLIKSEIKTFLANSILFSQSALKCWYRGELIHPKWRGSKGEGRETKGLVTSQSG